MNKNFGVNFFKSVFTGLATFILVCGGQTLWCTVTAWLAGGLPIYSCVPVTMGEVATMMTAQGVKFFGVPIIAACGRFVIYLLRPQYEEN